MRRLKNVFSYIVYRFIRFWFWVFYPRIKVYGEENIPDGPVVAVGNHAKLNAPIACTYYFPGKHRIWTIGEMMNVKDAPAYAFKDFWSKKPEYTKWFYKGLSYFIAPFASCLFNNAKCIGVYHDARAISTFRTSVEALHDGTRIIILPECDEAYNNIICRFQIGFVDLARTYYRKYKEEISFVPMYVAPSLKGLYFGKPIKYDSTAKIADERERITQALMDSITDMARSLPEHTVVPYPNIPSRLYPTNRMTDKAFNSDGIVEVSAN